MSEGYQGFMSNSQDAWLASGYGVQGNQGMTADNSTANFNALLYQQLNGYQGNQGYVASPQGNQALAYVADSQGNQGFVTSDTQGNQFTVYALSYQGFQANGGLLVGGGVQGVQSVGNNYISGGLLIGGQPYTTTPLRADSSGDLLVGGSGNEVITFKQIQCESTNCGCVVLDFNVTGGLSLRASTTVTQQRVGVGGLSIRGKARVITNNNGFVGLNWLIPLGDREQDPKELVNDLATIGNELVQDLGVFCLPSSRFTSEDLSNVLIEKDSLKLNQAFSLSFWVRGDNRFKQRCLFARGFYEPLNGGNWSVKISLGHYGQVVLTVRDSAGEQYETISTTIIREHLWSHVAVSYQNQLISLFVDGVFQRSLTLENQIPVSNGNSIGVWERSSFPDCWLQEFRCYESAKTADYWLAEKRNFCDYDNFVTVSGKQTPVLS